MNFAAVAFVGFAMGQPPAAPVSDIYPLNSKTIKLPIRYEKDRKAIRQVKLYVSRNGENTWYQVDAVPPDRDSFTYVAKEDGVYWFTMVDEDLRGVNNPADLTKTPPDLKVIVDTVQPRVQFTTTKRNGDDIVVEWFVDDKNPDEANTKVHFRPAGADGYWQEVTLPAASRSGVRFPAGSAGAVSVRVTACDIAGNKTEAVRDIGGNGAGNQTTTSLSTPPPASIIPPPPPPASIIPTTPPTPHIITPPAGTPISAGPLQPENLAPMNPISPGVAPIIPVQTAPPTTPGVQPYTPYTPPALATPVGGTALPGQAFPPTDPRQPVVPAIPPTTGLTGGPAPVAVWTGGTNPVAAPTVEVSRAQFLNYLTFDMAYEVESRGPSGIKSVVLWATRDDGKTWLKWSTHDGKAASVRVNLNVQGNPQHEGTYGFRVVPVSGAGLSEREPAPNDAPDLRVVVDITPPELVLCEPSGDPANPDMLVIQWKATDKNFGEDPITLEWAEKPTGPWQPVAGTGDVVQAGAGQPVQARRLPNTGQFAWRVPAGLPPRVFIKATARDAAGNVKEVINRDPFLIDLVKPKAKISGIVAPVGYVRP